MTMKIILLVTSALAMAGTSAAYSYGPGHQHASTLRVVDRFLPSFFALSIIFASSTSISFVGADAIGYTETEIQLSHILDWCVGDSNHPIQWVNKEEDVVNAKIAAGARPVPDRNKEGQISNLDAFVQDRVSSLPPEVIMDNLPTLIIENECASVTFPSDTCIFDYGVFAMNSFELLSRTLLL